MKKLFGLLSLISINLLSQTDGCPAISAIPYKNCENTVTYLNATPGFDSYSWSPAANVSNPYIANPSTTIPGTYTVTASGLSSTELVVNGDFSLGNTGFYSAYTYTPTYQPCNYFVGPGWFSSTYNASTPDHSPSSDNNFMSVDGCTSSPIIVWQETMPVTGHTNYTFSYWATKAQAVQPIYEIHFIGDVTGDNIVLTQTGSPWPGSWTWEKIMASCWASGHNSSVTIRVIDLQTGYADGNDFALDDFSFRQCCTSTCTATASVMGSNLFTNGDFSAGNTGFSSAQSYSTVYWPCDYYVGPSWFSSTYDPTNYPDHTPTSDNMFMSIDGCTSSDKIWEEGISILPHTIYNFSFYATRAYLAQPVYQVHFIGNVTGDVVVGTLSGTAGTGTWIWDQYGVPCWNSGKNTNVIVRIINLQTANNGDDFGMDDFTFSPCCNPNTCCIPNGRLAQTEDQNEVTSFNNLEVFPNPSNGTFQVQLSEAENAQAELFNTLGERVDAFTITGTTYSYTPTKTLAPGIYLLRVSSNGTINSKRIVIQ